MPLIKGSALGLIGALILSYILGKGGSSPSGILAVHATSIQNIDFYWSWPIFLGMAVLASAIFWMMDG